MTAFYAPRIERRSGFKYPAGRGPGFNPGHWGNAHARAVAGTLGTPNFRGFASGINFGNGFANLFSPPPPTVNGTVGQVNTKFGPASTFTTGAAVSSLDWPGPTAQPTAVTCACILITDSLPGVNQFVINDSTTAFTAQGISIVGSQWNGNWGGTGHAGSDALLTNTPYFLAWSCVSLSSLLVGTLVSVNLDTGKTIVTTNSDAGPIFGTTPNIIRIGDGGSSRGQVTCSILRWMYLHNGFVPEAGMRMWAQDPWSYWHPTRRISKPTRHLDMDHFRFRTDAGAVDATPTWGANQDANVTLGDASAFRLRVSVLNDGNMPGGGQFSLKASKNGGAFQDITTGSQNVKAADASSSPDDTKVIVPRLDW